MKPIHLNLASRPYRDYKPVYAVVVAASLAIAFLMFSNVDTYIRYFTETRSTREEIAKIEAQVRDEQRLADVAASKLRAINIANLSEQSEFVNNVLAERAFSWSELLDHLEETLGDDVRVKSIVPSVDKEGVVRLMIDCESRDANGLVDTLDALQKHPQFAEPFPGTDTSLPEQQLFQFNISVIYKPANAKLARRGAR